MPNAREAPAHPRDVALAALTSHRGGRAASYELLGSVPAPALISPDLPERAWAHDSTAR
jgi:hypothetical protein